MNVLLLLVSVRYQQAALLVEGCLEVRTGENDLPVVFFRTGECLFRGIFLMESMRIGLFTGNDRTCRKERFGSTDSGIELYAYVSGRAVGGGNAIEERTGDGLSRFGLDIFDTAFVNLFAVMADDVMEVVFVEIGEREIIAYLYDRGCRVEVEELDVLIHLPHFLGLRLDAAVGIYYAVDTEVAVGRGAVLAVVAAVCPVFTAVSGLGGKSLVYPVPNTAALQDGVFLDDVPVILEIAEAVAHGMGIFAEDERAGHFGVLCVFLDTGGTVVHGAEDVRVPFQQGAFVLHGTAVQCFQRIVGDVEVQAVSRFVAKRPGDDARMVLVALVHVHGAVYMRFCK